MVEFSQNQQENVQKLEQMFLWQVHTSMTRKIQKKKSMHCERLSNNENFYLWQAVIQSLAWLFQMILIKIIGIDRGNLYLLRRGIIPRFSDWRFRFVK